MVKTQTGQLVNRWWLVLLHGLLLIVLSYLLMSHTDMLFEKLGSLVAFLALFTGAMSILSSLLAGKNDRSPMDLVWGLVSFSAGAFFLVKSELTEYWIQWLLISFMALNTIHSFIISLQLSPQYRIWGYAILMLIYTGGVIYMFMSNDWLFDLPPLLFAGFQFFLNGILLAVIAFGIRKLQGEYGLKLSQLRSQAKEQSPLSQ